MVEEVEERDIALLELAWHALVSATAVKTETEWGSGSGWEWERKKFIKREGESNPCEKWSFYYFPLILEPSPSLPSSLFHFYPHLFLPSQFLFSSPSPTVFLPVFLPSCLPFCYCLSFCLLFLLFVSSPISLTPCFLLSLIYFSWQQCPPVFINMHRRHTHTHREDHGPHGDSSCHCKRILCTFWGISWRRFFFHEPGSFFTHSSSILFSTWQQR